MREILFRGRRTDGGGWAVGSLIKAGNFCCILDEDEAESMDYPYLGSDMGWIGGKVTPVIPETVGQFTGLTDENGKKIFEGDIVESEFTKKPYLVCFGEYAYTDEYGAEQSACGWYNEEKGGYVTAFGYPEAWATVIGNIHYNPELLKEGADND